MSIYRDRLVNLLINKGYDLKFVDLCCKVFENYYHRPDGHSQDHILDVVVRVTEYFDYYTLTPLDKEIIIIGAICHDLGLINGERKNHHIRSASMVGLNKDIINYFNDDVFIIHKIMECCLYHRSSVSLSVSIPFHAELVADADNDISYADLINRIVTTKGYEYTGEEVSSEVLEKIIQDGMKHLEEKFTRNGYQNFFVIHKLPHIQKVLEERYKLLEDKEKTYDLFLFTLKKYFNI